MKNIQRDTIAIWLCIALCALLGLGNTFVYFMHEPFSEENTGRPRACPVGSRTVIEKFERICVDSGTATESCSEMSEKYFCK